MMKIILMSSFFAVFAAAEIHWPVSGGIIGNGRPIDYQNPLLRFSVNYPEGWNRFSFGNVVTFSTPDDIAKKSVVRFSLENFRCADIDELVLRLRAKQSEFAWRLVQIDEHLGVLNSSAGGGRAYFLYDNGAVISIHYQVGDEHAEKEVKLILASVKLGAQ